MSTVNRVRWVIRQIRAVHGGGAPYTFWRGRSFWWRLIGAFESLRDLPDWEILEDSALDVAP